MNVACFLLVEAEQGGGVDGTTCAPNSPIPGCDPALRPSVSVKG